jgi:parallel beta-helix repeat protein
MSASNTTENDLALYIFDSTAPSWASNANFFVRLHSSDPGEAGTAVTNEISYTGYDGVSVSRTTGFTVSGNTASNAALLQFPLCSGGSATATHFSICTTQNGAGQIIVKGALSASLSISSGIQPQFNTGELDVVID